MKTMRFAHRTRLCMALLAVLPVLLRLALLPSHPVPNPRVSDDFSYLLLGDTLAHFRLTNPMHTMHRFFEGVFTLQEPSWSSSYPPGQGLALAAGQLLGHPWIGVVASVGILCALCYWMLKVWVAPEWALAGGLLAVITFGPLSSWMNSYWGGAVSAIAGCLIFGAIPRIKASCGTRDAVFLGLGLGLQMISRPYEFVFIAIGAGLFFLPVRAWIIAGVSLLPFAGLTLAHNHAVTGSYTTLPYVLSQHQYGIPATFTWQAMPAPENKLSSEQQIDYEAQTAAHARGTFLSRFAERFQNYRFFFLAPLYLAIPFFLPALKELRFASAVAVVVLLHIGTTFYPYFYPHYIAGIACLLLLIAVKGLEQMPRKAAFTIGALCLGHFAFWFGVHLTGEHDLLRFENSYIINEGDLYSRLSVNRSLHASGGKQLVFVRYSAQHGEVEWVHNAADIDGSKVVWARDLGPEEDSALIRYYPDRTAWFLDADIKPPRLSPFIGR